MLEKQAARGLGLASIGIGLTEIAAPRKLEEFMGIGNGQNTGVLRALGVREIMHGLDILAHRDPTTGVKARVAGDALDLALLGAAAKRTSRPSGLAMAFAMVLGITIIDALMAKRLDRKRQEQEWEAESEPRRGLSRLLSAAHR
ncbi:MAG: hypothetical protein JWN24_349 [Phycisphaerales bacterium]|jgi:hypothetical protein|nr:hypothetical protein [Phycisphaerales bacterium]